MYMLPDPLLGPENLLATSSTEIDWRLDSNRSVGGLWG